MGLPESLAIKPSYVGMEGLGTECVYLKPRSLRLNLQYGLCAQVDCACRCRCAGLGDVENSGMQDQMLWAFNQSPGCVVQMTVQ